MLPAIEHCALSIPFWYEVNTNRTVYVFTFCVEEVVSEQSDATGWVDERTAEDDRKRKQAAVVIH